MTAALAAHVWTLQRPRTPLQYKYSRGSDPHMQLHTEQADTNMKVKPDNWQLLPRGPTLNFYS